MLSNSMIKHFFIDFLNGLCIIARSEGYQNNAEMIVSIIQKNTLPAIRPINGSVAPETGRK